MMEFSDQVLGQNLRKAREMAGFTQDQLASKIGYSQDAVAAWEGGRRSAKPEILARLAVALGVPVASFFGETDEPVVRELPKDLLIPWDPSTGRVEICLNCLDASHKRSARFCETCGESLWDSTCSGWVQSDSGPEPCGVIIPPGANHCSSCGERSIWPQVREKIPNASFLQVVRSEFSQNAFITPQPMGRDFEVSDPYAIAEWIEEQVRIPDPRLSAALRRCTYCWGTKGSFIITGPPEPQFRDQTATTVQHNLSRLQTMLGFLLKRKCAVKFLVGDPDDEYRSLSLEDWVEIDNIPF